MKDIEELRGSWKRMSFNPGRLEEDNRRTASRLAKSRVVSAQQKLARHYRLSLMASVSLPVMSPLLVKLGFPLWSAAVYALFGLVMAAVNASFYRYINEVPLASLPCVPALARSVKIIRRQKLTSTISLTFAFMLCLALLAQAFANNEVALILGMVLGLVLAIVIATVKYRAKTRLANQIKYELSLLIKE